MKDERLESEEEYAEEISRIFLDDKKRRKSLKNALNPIEH